MNKHIPEGFNAQQLFEYLEQFTPEERAERKVFIRLAPEGVAMNVKSVDFVQDSTFGFFGTRIPCIVLNDSRFSPEEDEETSNVT